MNTGLALSARQDGLFQHVLATHDAHLAVVDHDAVDERAQIGLAEGTSPVMSLSRMVRVKRSKTIGLTSATLGAADLARSRAACAVARACLRSAMRTLRTSSTSSRPSSASL